MSDKLGLKAKMLLQAQTLVRTFAMNSLPGGREALARALGVGVDAPDRDIATECGYPAVVGIDQFRRLADRHGLAERVVNCPPDESWAGYPEVYETERDRATAFEKAFKALNRRVPLWPLLHRADRASGLGRYGVVYLGFDDTGAAYAPEQPVKPGGRKLVYAQVFAEDQAEIEALDESDWSPRCGLPTYYRLTAGPRPPGAEVLVASARKGRVHWSRVVHLGNGEPVWGKERMRSVYNYLLDLRKVLGGSAEMFWKGAFPGFSLEMLPEYVGGVDQDSVKEEMEAYHNHLQRWIALEGFKVNPIMPQIADPTNHVNRLIDMICATLGIPVRIFMGSESGHLASTQDAGNWAGRVRERRQLYLEPNVIRPVIDRLIEFGALPKPRAADADYIIKWPDSLTANEKDQADIALKTAQTLMQYATSGAEKLYPFKFFLTHVLRRTEDEAKAVMEEIESNPTLYTKELWQQLQGPQGGGRNGAAAGGRPAANEASTSA